MVTLIEPFKDPFKGNPILIIKAPKLNADVRTWGGPAPTTVAETVWPTTSRASDSPSRPLQAQAFGVQGFWGFWLRG